MLRATGGLTSFVTSLRRLNVLNTSMRSSQTNLRPKSKLPAPIAGGSSYQRNSTTILPKKGLNASLQPPTLHNKMELQNALTEFLSEVPKLCSMPPECHMVSGNVLSQQLSMRATVHLHAPMTMCHPMNVYSDEHRTCPTSGHSVASRTATSPRHHARNLIHLRSSSPSSDTMVPPKGTNFGTPKLESLSYHLMSFSRKRSFLSVPKLLPLSRQINPFHQRPN